MFGESWLSSNRSEDENCGCSTCLDPNGICCPNAESKRDAEKMCNLMRDRAGPLKVLLFSNIELSQLC